MSRYIDADALMNKYKGHHDFYLNAWGGDFKSMDAKDKARCDELINCIAEIVNAPTIDIVRCGECKWYDNGQNESDSWNYCTRHFGHYIDVNDDDYCSYGEREGE